MHRLTIALVLLPLLVCSCSSTYVFHHPYKEVVDATLKHCEEYEKKSKQKPGSTAGAFRYHGKTDGRGYRLQIFDVYGKEESTVKIRPKSDRRTKVSVRTVEGGPMSSSRVREAEQEWLMRIARQLRSRAPADKRPFKIRQEE